jgi:hypothetical protein
MLAAAKLFSDMKSRPQEALRSLLTRAAASGINVAELGIQGLNGADAKSMIDLVREEIQKATQPITEQNQRTQETERQRQEREEQDRRAQDEVNYFFAENPEARRYHSVFVKTLQNPEFSNMSLGEIWARIQLNLERQARSGTRPNPRNPRPPQGRGVDMREQERNAPAPASQSYDDILRDVMREQGIR